MMDGRDVDAFGLEDFEDATRTVELGDGVVDADEYEGGIEVFHLGDGIHVFGAVDFNGKADCSFRELKRVII